MHLSKFNPRVFAYIGLLISLGCTNQQELATLQEEKIALEEELTEIQGQLIQCEGESQANISSFSEQSELIDGRNHIFFSAVIRGRYVPGIDEEDGKNVMRLDEFMQYLKSLNIFTDRYLTQRRKFFRQCELDISTMDRNADLDEIRDMKSCDYYNYNLFMRTQEPANLFKIINLNVDGETASADMEFFDLNEAEYLMQDVYLNIFYKLKSQQWLIDEVRIRRRTKA